MSGKNISEKSIFYKPGYFPERPEKNNAGNYRDGGSGCYLKIIQLFNMQYITVDNIKRA